MSSPDANASAGAKNIEANAGGDVSEHDQMLDVLDSAIDEAHRKVESGRVYDAENEKVRIKWIRALAYTINVRRQVVVDRDLEELTERIEELEELQEDH